MAAKNGDRLCESLSNPQPLKGSIGNSEIVDSYSDDEMLNYKS